MVDAGSDQTINEGEAINFNGNFTDAGINDTHTFAWDFGDGTIEYGRFALAEGEGASGCGIEFRNFRPPLRSNAPTTMTGSTLRHLPLPITMAELAVSFFFAEK